MLRCAFSQPIQTHVRRRLPQPLAVLATLALAFSFAVLSGCQPAAPPAPPADPNLYGTAVAAGELAFAVAETTVTRRDDMVETTVQVRVQNNGTQPVMVSSPPFQLVNAAGEPQPEFFKAFQKEFLVPAGQEATGELYFRLSEAALGGPLYLELNGARRVVKDGKTLSENRMPVFEGSRIYISPYWSEPEATRIEIKK